MSVSAGFVPASQLKDARRYIVQLETRLTKLRAVEDAAKAVVANRYSHRGAAEAYDVLANAIKESEL